VTTDADTAGRLKLPALARLVHIELDRSWLPARVARRVLEASLTQAGLFDELARFGDVRTDGGTERVRPVIPTAAERSASGIGSDVATFAIERLGCGEGAPGEWRQSLVRGDRYGFVVELLPRRVKHPSLPWATGSSAA
jgi:GntR family transcriptional regulator